MSGSDRGRTHPWIGGPEQDIGAAGDGVLAHPLSAHLDDDHRAIEAA